MATPASPGSIFHRSLELFKIGLSDREKADFELTTLEEVHEAIDKIQDEQASKRRMQNMARIQGFLEGMEQYGNVIEVFLNVSIFVAFVWGPVKFLLQIAKTWSESLETLLNAYEQIGETIPQLLQYDKLFKQNPAMQFVLGLIYKDILEFHRRALVVFTRRSWKELFSSTWKDFDTHFKRLLENLRRHKQDIESQASLIEIEHNHKLRIEKEKQFQADEKRERARQSIAVIEKISPANFHLDQENSSKIWRKEPEFGSWLLNHNQMKDWLDSGNTEAEVLWLKGIPGAGKSVLASRVIAEVKNHKPLVFFYCKNEDRSRSSLNAVLKGFLAQLTHINPEVLTHIYEECSRSNELALETLEFLKKLVEYSLEGPQCVWIIIDGLDECDKREKKKILAWILGVVDAENHTGRIRLLVISQDEGDIRKFLAKKAVISLSDAPQHEEAIRKYAARKSVKLRNKFEFLLVTEHHIIDMVTNSSKGMFLFARLVLKHLKSQTSLDQLEEELDPAKFPKELYEIYDRIIQRIFSNGAPQRQAAEKILSWVTCAKRALQWHEIQSVFSIDLDSSVVDFARRRLRGVDIKDLCGSLVEMSPSRSIEMVHHTARSYLLDQTRPNMEPIVNVRLTNMKIATTCIQYLNFPCFVEHLTAEEVSSYVYQGYYALQEYAVAYWLDHLESCVNAKAHHSLQDLDQLSIAVDKLMNMHLENYTSLATATNTTLASGSDSHRIYSQLRLARSAFKKQAVPQEKSSQHVISLQENLQRRRSIFEEIILQIPANDPKKSELSIFYGDAVGWFKCPHLQCFAFHEGFPTRAIRDSHSNKHTRNFRCSFSGCLYATVGFARESELKRHTAKSHIIVTEDEEWRFPQPRARGKATLEEKSLDNSGSQNESSHTLNRSSPTLTSLPPAGVAPVSGSISIPAATRPDSTLVENLAEAVSALDLRNECYNKLTAYRKKLDSTEQWLAVFNETSPRLLDIDLVYTFQHPSVVTSVTFSKDGKFLATACNRTVYVFESTSGRIAHCFDLAGSAPGDIYCRNVSFSFDGRYLATGWEDKLVRIWDLESSLLKIICRGHEDQIYSSYFSQKDYMLASCGGDKTVRLWDIETGDCIGIKRAEDIITCVTIYPDNKFIAFGCLDKKVYVWNILTDHLYTLNGHTDAVYGIHFSSDGREIISASLDKSIKRWAVDQLDGNPLDEAGITDCSTFIGHLNFVLGVTSSSDGRWIISGSKDRSVQFWDSDTGKGHAILRGHRNSVISVATSPTHNLLATASGDWKMRLWKYKEIEKPKVSNLHSLLG